jgi:hypothetical protein
MGEWAVADVMKESRGNDKLPFIIGHLEPAAGNVSKIHGPKGMLEPGMVCTRVNKEREAELPYVAEALECGGVHQRPGKILDLDIAMDRVLDDLQGH